MSRRYIPSIRVPAFRTPAIPLLKITEIVFAASLALNVATMRGCDFPDIPWPVFPVPTPVDPPPVDPPPSQWGPLARFLVLYESSKLTGRESFYAQDVIEALTATAPAENGHAGWRIWDKDLDAIREPAWLPAFEAAKADYVTATNPRLYAFDAQNRMQVVELNDGFSPEQVALTIRGFQ
jgi:hypothetical protein